MTTALLTDHYELTMLQAALRSGVAERGGGLGATGRGGRGLPFRPDRDRVPVGLVGRGHVLVAGVVPLLRLDGCLSRRRAVRRTHEWAAVAAARAAWLAGFDATSNLEAGRRYGVPTAGTAAHAFTLVHDSESAAFAAQVLSLGVGTTLLIDTFDMEQGLQAAMAATGLGLDAGVEVS